MHTNLKTLLSLLVAATATAASLRAAAPFRLDFLPVTIFRASAYPGQAIRDEATLDCYKGIAVRSSQTANLPIGLPTLYYNQPLIATATWDELAKLAPTALANFGRPTGPFVIEGITYHLVLPRFQADVSTGTVANISTRAWAGSGDDAAIAGFIIEDRPRTVLVRGVGPGLLPFGVANALVDPVITLFRNTTPYYENINWETTDAAAKAAAATQVGAFPLSPGSKDAALLVELSPGAYTIRLSPATGEAGVGLLEVYALPDSSLLPPPSW